jgi:hypothetical protein
MWGEDERILLIDIIVVLGEDRKVLAPAPVPAKEATDRKTGPASN